MPPGLGLGCIGNGLVRAQIIIFEPKFIFNTIINIRVKVRVRVR